jgi:hypothetical protein
MTPANQGMYCRFATLYNVLLRIARNLLETRENIKILTRFSKSPILEKKLRKFHRLVLGLVGLIDAKAINVAQPIWS